ncbi:MAG: molybdenum cofactor guanylyltransferase [Luminiphilus sp.]|nr:molybdenum cofactor guanylyltransferase [Luminiphilus sp.]
MGILAGGKGHRWGGRDKGLIALKGRPLVAGLVGPCSKYVQEVLICCRTHPHFYQHYSDRVLCEAHPDQGPCAGIIALLASAKCESIIILPVDLIGAPEFVTKTLEDEWQQTDTAIALYDEKGRHSPCMRLRRDVLLRCEAYFNTGGKHLAGLLEAANARPVTVPSLWLKDANRPAVIEDQAEA